MNNTESKTNKQNQDLRLSPVRTRSMTTNSKSFESDESKPISIHVSEDNQTQVQANQEDNKEDEERYNTAREDDEETNRIVATLEEHRRLFILQHSVYSKLRIVAPTEVEMKDTRNCVKEMERQWRKMAISVTPKAHLIFVHSADDQVRWNGLGDKVEDD